ncbi:uncharacterized protein N7479_006050 [Penicillium vulpinum]|uniref:Uncharacterized protein n=1 Tax=Penicillium vulpinum TaxID=29845 RepID=A0A1V6SEL1_9EURO|nr:uncharacterized protein N7479_006050 [Penicillium vulpinum]KAJ5958900.1 hypothetical protein N7479_006050 [Penicillium vulpinum]OQE12164.1 hypothetical protein PENVUL_c001G03768 [Penicillium vulpinum]
MPRTTMRLHANMKANDANERKIWRPLHLDNAQYPQIALDRQSVLDFIRSVYDPLLIAWLAVPGNTWANQFSSNTSGNEFQEQVIARMEELPSGIQSIERETVLGKILYDILRFYRFTDAAWRVPLPGAAAAPPPPPPPPPPPGAAAPVPAPAPAAAPAHVWEGSVLAAAIALGVVTTAANLEVLADAAEQVLGPDAPATANPPTPLEILAEAASVAEPSPVVSPTSSLDILADAAAGLPYAPVPAPAAAAAAAPAPVNSPASGNKRDRDEESEDESERPAKKKQAVSPK